MCLSLNIPCTSFDIPTPPPLHTPLPPFCFPQAALEKLSRADKKLAQQVLPHIADMPSKLQKYRCKDMTMYAISGGGGAKNTTAVYSIR